MLLWAQFKSQQGQWCYSGVICLNADGFLSNTPKLYWLFQHFYTYFISKYLVYKSQRNLLPQCSNICWFALIVAFAELLFNLGVINIQPPPSTVDRIINIRELNSCLVADVCCCCTFLSAPGGERSTQGCRVKRRFSWRHYMLLHWKKQTNEHLPVPRNRHQQIKISIIDCSI